jgi:tetratricopeptide (TPR) repeat protein
LRNQPQQALTRPKFLFGAAAIFTAAFAAYAPALRSGFVWDDEGFVTRSDLRSWHGLGRIWFEVGATEQYYPALHSAFWIEHRLWGDAPLGYHLANIAFHAASACLLWILLRRWRLRGATLAAFVFTLHPVCVESVAWIAEQKNTLSLFFYLAAALVYARFEESRDNRSRAFFRDPRYLGATLFFILALLSKSVAATLPAALLVVSWWRRGVLRWKDDVRPLAPWFAIGAAFGLFTAWVERRFVGAAGPAFALSLTQRFLVAGRAIFFYLGKSLWPAHLNFIYPRWTPDAGIWWQYLPPLGALALGAALWRIRRKTRAPLAAYLFFVGSLFPTLGFFNVYAFVFSYVADHWQYLAILGVIVPVSAALSAAAAGAPDRIRALAPAASLLLLGALGALTWRQAETYRDIDTFYQTILARNPNAWMADNNYGMILGQAGRFQEAIPHFERALRSNPYAAEVHNNLGIAFAKLGRPSDAAAQFEAALRIEPNYLLAHFNLALALMELGRTDEAEVEYRESQAPPRR